MDRRKALLAGGAVAVSLIIALPVFAAETASGGTTPPSAAWQAFGHRLAARGIGIGGGIVGTVTAINGSTITLTGKDGGTYAIDASSATIAKDKNTPLALSDIKVGDTLLVGGKVVTATITAANIRDGLPPAPFGKGVTFGAVQSVSGSTFTIARKGPNGGSTVTVTTDANTTFKKNGQADTLADVSAGELVVVAGTKDGSGNIAATSVNIMTPRSK